jgi:hypothetical protein
MTNTAEQDGKNNKREGLASDLALAFASDLALALTKEK